MIHHLKGKGWLYHLIYMVCYNYTGISKKSTFFPIFFKHGYLIYYLILSHNIQTTCKKTAIWRESCLKTLI